MNALRNLSIRRKLILISMVASGVAVLLALVTLLAQDEWMFRRQMVRNLASTAEMIGFNSSSALSFDDARSAEQTMRSLQAQPRIVAACIYESNGNVFSTYLRPGATVTEWPASQPEVTAFAEDALHVLRGIEVDGERIGAVYLRSDLRELHDRRLRYLLVAIAALCAAALGAWLVAAGLQRLISGPIADLLATSRRVAERQDYTLRAQKHGSDELGHLIDGFNGMLQQVQVRDAALQAAHQGLERRVEERTAELRGAQEATARERARFKFIFDSVPVGISWLVPEREDTYLVNPAYEQIIGLSGESSQGDAYERVSHPDDYGRERELRQALLDGRVMHYSHEKRFLHADGRVVWAAVTSRMYADPTSGLRQWVTTLVDITARKEAEAEREELQRQLLDTSRRAGMAEVATSVLHNVGNVLTSVNVSTTLLAEALADSKVPLLGRLSGLLQEHTNDLADFLTTNSAGRQIPGYLQLLVEHLNREHAAMREEVGQLRRNIEHIKEIVAMQQSYARVSGLVETVDPTELVDAALQINAGPLREADITVQRNVQPHLRLAVEKHKVLQILVNFIRNAAQACADAKRPDLRVIVSVEGLPDRVRISVADNGVGISAEQLPRMFTYGLTTRAGGHGFGLHSGALAAQELGGRVAAHSDGVQRGATFTLELPLEPGRELT